MMKTIRPSKTLFFIFAGALVILMIGIIFYSNCCTDLDQSAPKELSITKELLEAKTISMQALTTCLEENPRDKEKCKMLEDEAFSMRNALNPISPTAVCLRAGNSIKDCHTRNK